MNKLKQILGCFVLVLSRVVLCCTRVVLVLSRVVLCCVVLVLSCVVSCCLVYVVLGYNKGLYLVT